MKFLKLGKRYSFNDEDLITNSHKTVEIDTRIIDIVNEVVRYVYSIEEVEPDSVYLRGSCLESNIDRALDIDLTIVYNQVIDLKGNYGFTLSDGKWSHSDQLRELYSKMGIFPDFQIMSTLDFRSCRDLRFLSKKVYGSGEDLSLSSISLSSLRKLYSYPETLDNHRNMSVLKKILHGDVKADRVVFERVIKNLVEDFYRDFGIDMLLKDRMYSRSLYMCHKTLLKSMPNLSDKLEKVLDLFLNTGNYSYEDVKPLIHEMVYLSKELQHQ